MGGNCNAVFHAQQQLPGAWLRRRVRCDGVDGAGQHTARQTVSPCLPCLQERIHTAVARGGRVLLPVVALGRAQELLLILEEYWERHPELHGVPIYQVRVGHGRRERTGRAPWWRSSTAVVCNRPRLTPAIPRQPSPHLSRCPTPRPLQASGLARRAMGVYQVRAAACSSEGPAASLHAP